MAYTGSKYIEDDYLSIARGHIKDASHIHKFGAVPALSINNTGSIWDVNDTLYPWSAFNTAGVLTIPAVDVSDNGKTVRVYGLDQNFNEQIEDFTVSSTGTTTSTKTFKRVHRAYITNGSAANVADINVQRAGTTVLRITAGKAQTLMAIYTVPKGYTGYLVKGTMSCQAGADATGDMFVRYSGQSSFRVGHSFEVSGAGGHYTYEFGIPIHIPAMSDIDVRAKVRSNNARITAAFDLVLFRGNR
jgi:hypothetical protein